MSYQKLLEQAIEAARAGRKSEACDLLLKVVDENPQSEIAWMWLSGLVDSLEDRMIACENVLTINPANEKVRSYLLELQQQYRSLQEQKNIDDALELFNQAKSSMERRDLDRALRLARQAVEKHDGYEDAWLLIGQFSPNVNQRVAALENAQRLNPLNGQTTLVLEQARHLRDDPLGAATRLEQLGKLDEALKVFNEVAAKTKNSKEFDRIFKHILHLEALQKENIRHVAPSSSIMRLTFGWPLLYLFLILIQVGLNPFAHPVLHLWLGFPWVVAGSFLLALAEVRSRHTIWQKLFFEKGDGSDFARLVTAVAGWLLVIFPYILLLLDSINRLQNFKIPHEPF